MYAQWYLKPGIERKSNKMLWIDKDPSLHNSQMPRNQALGRKIRLLMTRKPDILCSKTLHDTMGSGSMVTRHSLFGCGGDCGGFQQSPKRLGVTRQTTRTNYSHAGSCGVRRPVRGVGGLCAPVRAWVTESPFGRRMWVSVRSGGARPGRVERGIRVRGGIDPGAPAAKVASCGRSVRFTNQRAR